jgi:hypothetical protein
VGEEKREKSKIKFIRQQQQQQTNINAKTFA